MRYFHNTTILTPHRRIDNGAVLVESGRVTAVGPAEAVTRPADAQIIDAGGLLLVPGFIDLQVNGGFGHDFTAKPESIWPVAAGLPRYGITSFLPTIITSPLETIAAAQQVLAGGTPAGFRGATPLGLHVEGPFLNPAKKGAHNPAHLRPPSLDAAADWTPQQAVRLVTLAPELPGAVDVVKILVERGVVVSAGHSLATYAQAQAAFEAGVTYGTHLFNAMPPLAHREPGLPGALLTNPALTVGLIPDGIHVHPAVIALIWAAKGGARLTLVTDAMAALGMSPGRYQIGDQAVIVTETDARLEDGTLAGSTVSLDAALRNLMEFTGCSLAEALPAVTSTPALLLGLPDRGQIAPGFMADLVLLTPELRVGKTIVAGQVVYSRAVGQPLAG